MRMHDRRVKFDPSVGALALFLLSGNACNSDDTGASNTEGSTTTATATTLTSSVTETPTTTGYEPDEQPCDMPKFCNVAADCCEGEVHEGGPCPGTAYPNNWTCEQDGSQKVCKHGGCTTSADCTDIFPGYTCMVLDIDNVGHCVAPCSVDDDCNGKGTYKHNLPGTQCVGESTAGPKFCLEPIP